MNKRPKLAGRELILLLVPAFALLGWGTWLQSRGPAEPRKPFKLIIDGVQVAPIPKGTYPPTWPKHRRIQAVVFIGHEGPAPAWWGTGVSSESATNALRVNFTGKGEKDDGVSNVGAYQPARFDGSRSQYTFVYTGSIPEDPNFLKQASCHISVALETLEIPPKKLASAKASIPGHRFK